MRVVYVYLKYLLFDIRVCTCIGRALFCSSTNRRVYRIGWAEMGAVGFSSVFVRGCQWLRGLEPQTHSLWSRAEASWDWMSSRWRWISQTHEWQPTGNDTSNSNKAECWKRHSGRHLCHIHNANKILYTVVTVYDVLKDWIYCKVKYLYNI